MNLYVVNSVFSTLKQKRKKKRKPQSYFWKDLFFVSPILESFLQVHHGKKVTRRDILVALQVYVHYNNSDKKKTELRKWRHLNKVNRNLRENQSPKYIILDSSLSKILNKPIGLRMSNAEIFTSTLTTYFT